jgi:PilZ domain-containing protein
MKTTEQSRRAYRRRAVQLEVKIIFRPPKSFTTAGDAGRLSLVGRTRNISETGMALLVSARNIDRYLNAKENAFDVELRLPDGAVTLEVTPVYFKKTLTGTVATYLIGSRFSKARKQEHTRLITFLRSLPASQPT